MAFVGHHTALGPLNDRKQAFVEVMQRYAPEIEFTTVADSDGYAGGRRAVQALFASGFKPTAILCVNDFMAVGVLRQLRDMGLDVPRDVSVAGFDNISLSEVLFPSLTTLHIPRDQIGRRIFESLTTQKPCLQEVVIEPELMVRESTGPAPRSCLVIQRLFAPRPATCAGPGSGLSDRRWLPAFRQAFAATGAALTIPASTKAGPASSTLHLRKERFSPDVMAG